LVKRGRGGAVGAGGVVWPDRARDHVHSSWTINLNASHSSSSPPQPVHRRAAGRAVLGRGGPGGPDRMVGVPREGTMTLSLPIDADANELLSRSPLALLTGMLLDQQVPFEKAFTSPRDLVRRLGHEPTARDLPASPPPPLAPTFPHR